MMEDLMNQCKCFIVMLLIGFLSASNPTVISSLSRPINDETFLTPPLTEDNFTSVFPIVCTLDGCIEGRATPGFQIDEYESFFGIPYAEPPIGRLRFANPVPKKPWLNLLNGKVERANCAQKNVLVPNATFEGDEDCLYLNIYRPTTGSLAIWTVATEEYILLPVAGAGVCRLKIDNTSAKRNASLPVIVYIHEGGFFSGSIHTLFRGPHYFMDTKEVIMVLMTYRLGVLGFLSTGDEASSGNFGLKDQTLALKWIKRNIKAFGGDPDNITIMGASAGGASVHMHMMSPLSAGLFNRAIALSGLATAPYNEPTQNPLALAKRQAEVLGIVNIDQLSTTELIDRLREINVSVLVNSVDDLKFWSVDPITLYRTVIEPKAEGAFLVDHPASIWSQGLFKQVPWMIGIVPNEGTVRAAAILTNKDLLGDLNGNFDKLLPKLMEFNKEPAKLPIITKRIKEFYLNGSSVIKETNGQNFINLYTDISFHYPYYKAIEAYIKYANTTKNPVHLVKFAYKGSLSYSRVFTGTDKNFGVGHIDDLIYLFKTPLLFREFATGSDSAQMVRTLVSTYVNFAKHGRPLQWNEVNECKKFYRGNICDYQEFRNMNGDAKTSKFEVRTSNEFDMAMIRFWDEVLCL